MGAQAHIELVLKDRVCHQLTVLGRNVITSKFLCGSGGWVGARSSRAGKWANQTSPRLSARLFSNFVLAQSRHVAPASSMWKAMRSFPKRRPFATNIGLSLIVSGASDIVAQRAEG